MIPPVPHFDPSRSQPFGGLLVSEFAAHAANDQHITGEKEAPVSNFYCSHVPRVTEWSFPASGTEENQATPAGPRTKTPQPRGEAESNPVTVQLGGTANGIREGS